MVGGGRHLVVFCSIQASLVRKRRLGKFSGFKESEFLLRSKNIPAEKKLTYLSIENPVEPLVPALKNVAKE